MATCTSCGHDVTGKKFCPQCGTSVQPASTQSAGGGVMATCSRCNESVRPGTAFCIHCGATLLSQASAPTPPPLVTTRPCPACQTPVSTASAFCTQCGYDLHAAPQMAAPGMFCTNCGKQNDAGVHFCGGCGSRLGTTSSATAQAGYAQSGPYAPQPGQAQAAYPQPPYQQTPYPQQSQYGQSQYPQQYGQPQYPQQSQYGQPQYPQQYGQQPYNQGGYQSQPMMGQGPMVLRCPVCMAMAPLGTPNCVSCRTSLAGVVPIPANMPAQGQGQGNFLQGNGGKYAMGALGGVAAVVGGEMLLHGLENRVEGDGGYRRHHREEGLLGGLGELADDIGL